MSKSIHSFTSSSTVGHIGVFAGLILVPGPYVRHPCVRSYFAGWVFQTNIATRRRTHNPQNASECVNISLYNLNPGAPKEIWGRVMSSPSPRPLQCCAWCSVGNAMLNKDSVDPSTWAILNSAHQPSNFSDLNVSVINQKCKLLFTETLISQAAKWLQ